MHEGFINKSTLDEPLKIAKGHFSFAETLAKVVSSSFEQGIFPQALKATGGVRGPKIKLGLSERSQ